MVEDRYKFPPIDVPVFADDGRRVHRFRASSLKTIDTCLEMARRGMTGTIEDRTSDAAAAGTAVHAAIEWTLRVQMRLGKPLDFEDAASLALEEFTALSERDDFEWVKFSNPGRVHDLILHCLSRWYHDVLPHLDPLYVEWPFGPLVLLEDEQRVIELVGTIDYISTDYAIRDWKTVSGKAWEGWEKKRWDLQSTVYTWAVHETFDVVPVFEFDVFHEKRIGNVEWTPFIIERHEGDWAWLKRRALVVAQMIEANLETWPLNDNHALCSPKWCGAWADCKGKFYGPDWPKKSEPSESVRTGSYGADHAQ